MNYSERRLEYLDRLRAEEIRQYRKQKELEALADEILSHYQPKIIDNPIIRAWERLLVAKEHNRS